MGVVEEVGSEVRNLSPGDRVVVPFNVSCGHCFYCERKLHSQCETTQVTERGKGGSLFGYTKLYGQVPGGQAERLRVPFADFGPIKVPEGPPDERFLYLSDVVPTSWQAVEYANVPPGGSVLVLGLGPIGQMCARIAKHRGAGTVIGVDLVDERLELARQYGIDTIDLREHKHVADVVRDRTDGRGADSVVDAVGMEAHGAPLLGMAQQLATMLPKPVAAKAVEKAAVDRLTSLYLAIDAVRRGGTISLSGVYGGMIDPIPMMTLFDKQIQLRMGQANVHAWINDVLPLVTEDSDPLGVEGFATHRLPLSEAPDAYRMFQKKQDGVVKVVLQP